MSINLMPCQFKSVAREEVSMANHLTGGQNCSTTKDTKSVKESSDKAPTTSLEFGDITQPITAFDNAWTSILRVLRDLRGEFSLASVLRGTEQEVTARSKRQEITENENLIGMNRQAQTAFLFLLLLPLLSVLAFAQAGTILRVQTGSSIQAVIDQASAGTTIELPQGTWQENLRIERSLVIRGTGAGETIINGRSDGYPAIWIASTGVQTVSVAISGITVSAGSSACADASQSECADGILAEGQATITVNDSSFTNSYAGIWLRSSANATIMRSTLLQNTYGMVISEQAQARISNCTISGSAKDGMIVADDAQLTLNSNTIADNKRTGISVDIPPCYNTSRTFGGLIIGGNNTIPTSSADQGNGIAICPASISLLSSRDGGFWPTEASKRMLSSLPTPPPVEGNTDAPVTILEFTDFTCPYCNRFATETLPRIVEDYIDTGKAKLYFLPFPVHGVAAYRAAEAGFCAQEQGLFWDFRRLLIAQHNVRGSSVLTPAWLAAIAAAVGADREQFLNSLTAGTYSPAVQETIALGENLGVDGTPTFFINGKKIPGAAPYEVFAQMIDQELAHK